MGAPFVDVASVRQGDGLVQCVLAGRQRKKAPHSGARHALIVCTKKGRDSMRALNLLFFIHI